MDEPVDALCGLTLDEFKNELINAGIKIDDKKYLYAQYMIDELVNNGVERQTCNDILFKCVKKYVKHQSYDIISTFNRSGYYEMVLYDKDWLIINESLIWAYWDPVEILLEKYYKKDEWKRGDIIGIINYESFGYRNNGKYIWDGEKLTDLEYSIDDYGSVPNTFLVGKEFNSALYWTETVDHNNYIFAQFDKEFVSDLKILDQDVGIFTFKYNEIPWLIFSNDTTTLFESPMLCCNIDELKYNYDIDKFEQILSQYNENNVLVNGNVNYLNKLD